MAHCDLNEVIRIAQNEVGYLEKKSDADLDHKTANAGKNNYTRYNRDYMAWDKLAEVEIPDGSINMQWCAAFVSWCFVMAYGLKAAAALLCGGLHCYTPTGASRFKKAGRYIQRGKGMPRPGDVVFFWSSSKGRIGHVGLVYRVTASRVYTIEGNTSAGSALITNGGGVATKSYSLSSTYIDGYGRPDYEGVEAGTGVTVSLELGDRLLTRGCRGDDVKELQEALKQLGYDLGSYGVDGDFGRDTEDALKAFQEERGLEADGEYGPLSHAAMLAALEKRSDVPVIAPEHAQGLKVKSGSWNVRTGPGTAYPTAGIVHGGDALTELSAEGWLPVIYRDEVMWISKSALEEQKDV